MKRWLAIEHPADGRGSLQSGALPAIAARRPHWARQLAARSRQAAGGLPMGATRGSKWLAMGPISSSVLASRRGEMVSPLRRRDGRTRRGHRCCFTKLDRSRRAARHRSFGSQRRRTAAQTHRRDGRIRPAMSSSLLVASRRSRESLR